MFGRVHIVGKYLGDFIFAAQNIGNSQFAIWHRKIGLQENGYSYVPKEMFNTPCFWKHDEVIW